MPSSLPPPLSSSDACLQQLHAGRRHAGQDAGHDQQADAVADAELVDLLAEPHQEHRAGGHRQHGDDLPMPDELIADAGQERRSHQIACGSTYDSTIEPALEHAEKTVA